LNDLAKLMMTPGLAFLSGIAVTVVGAYIVHNLTRSRERDSWVRDSRIKEWQELLAVLTKAYMLQLSVPNDLRTEALVALEATKESGLADVEMTLSTRIFITRDIERLSIRTKWAQLVSDYQLTRRSRISGVAAESERSFKNEFQQMRMSMVEAAKKTN
jgi:hypothetical protein